MTRDDDNHPEDNDLNDFATDPFNRRTEEQQGLEGFGERFADEFDDAYDEPERDTPYAPAYREEEEDMDSYRERPFENQDMAAEDEAGEQDNGLYDNLTDNDAEDHATPATEPWNTQQFAATSEDPWTDDPDYVDDTDESDPDFNQRLPMGLLLVAVIAVVLLIAGGYGVMQQRAESKEEIRQLHAALATAASDEDIEKVRTEATALQSENAELQDLVYDLQIENRKLTDLVAGLEAQIEAANTKPARPAAAPVEKKTARAAAQPAPVAKTPSADKPATSTPAAGTPAATHWFVNFGSYGQQSVADSWRDKLEPSAGEVITAASERDGRTFYRVRVVNLPDKETANTVARALEKQYGLQRLWVGQQ